MGLVNVRGDGGGGAPIAVACMREQANMIHDTVDRSIGPSVTGVRGVHGTIGVTRQSMRERPANKTIRP